MRFNYLEHITGIVCQLYLPKKIQDTVGVATQGKLTNIKDVPVA